MSTGKVVGAIAAGCGCLTVAMIVACGGLLFTGYRAVQANAGPEIDRMFAAIDDGTFAETYESVTTHEFRAVTGKEQYADIGKAVSARLGKLKSKSLKRFNMGQHNADSLLDVVYDAQFEHGTGQIVAKLKLEDGQYKFVNFHVSSPVFQQDIATTKCPKCGAPHAANARFCPACGAALATEAEKSTEAKPPDESP